MVNPTAKSMVQDLPEHVLFLILLWLPVKSLLRFKAVCKYWYALIESSTFITQHLRYQQENVSCSLIVRKSIIDKSGFFMPNQSRFFMLTGEKFDEASICLDFANEEMRRYKINSSQLISQLRVGNFCNGIICLYIHQLGFEDVALWNPSTKQLQPLPLPRISVSRPPQPEILSYPLLGFDIKTNDYKVVKIIYSNETAHEPDSKRQVEVYNLSTDAWRIIHRDYVLPFDRICWVLPKLVYKNGICFFCAEKHSKESKLHRLLISFDFSTETFRTMPMPNTYKFGVIPYALDFLDDNVVCILNDPVSEFTPNQHYQDYVTNQLFDIWVLHGYGTKESWTKLYTIGPFDGFYPKKILKVREFHLLSMGSRLCLYNLVTQEMQDLGFKDPDSSSVFVFYNECLVSIEGKNGATNREASLLQFAKAYGDGYETEEEEEKKDEEIVESQSEVDSQEDREIKDFEDNISNELDLGHETEEEEDERDENQSEQESHEDREMKDLENNISSTDELDLGYLTAEEEDEERVESHSEEESQKDKEIKDLKNNISNELDLGLEHKFGPSRLLAHSD